MSDYNEPVEREEYYEVNIKKPNYITDVGYYLDYSTIVNNDRLHKLRLQDWKLRRIHYRQILTYLGYFLLAGLPMVIFGLHPNRINSWLFIFPTVAIILLIYSHIIYRKQYHQIFLEGGYIQITNVDPVPLTVRKINDNV